MGRGGESGGQRARGDALRRLRHLGAAAARQLDSKRLDPVVHHARANGEQLGRILLDPVRHVQGFDDGLALDLLEREAGRRDSHDRGHLGWAGAGRQLT